jgi:hypothetical protein
VGQVIEQHGRQVLDGCREFAAAAQRGVDACQRGRDLLVLRHHRVDRGQAGGIAERPPQDRPEVVVLGRVVVAELRAGTKEDLFYRRLEVFGTRLAEAVRTGHRASRRSRRSAVPCSPRAACSPRSRRATPGPWTSSPRSTS